MKARDIKGIEEKKKPYFRGTIASVAALATAVLSLLVVQATFAHDDHTSPYFTPTLKLASSDVSAGEHPNLTIRMRKAKPNDCTDLELYPWGPSGCSDPNPYIEQGLRDWNMNFPSGLMADIMAVPERCNNPQQNGAGEYSCPPGSKIGEVPVPVGWRRCRPPEHYGGCADASRGILVGGDVYMGTPLAGEQARLHTIVKASLGGQPWVKAVRVDTVVIAKQGQGGLEIEALTRDIPDSICTVVGGCGGENTMAQIYDMAIVLDGSIGAERGHPLLTNPTSCSQRYFGSTFTGYEGYSLDGEGSQGYGNTVTDTAPFPVRGCNRLDYSPSFAINLSPNIPGAIPALTTTLSQDQGEQTTKDVVVRFPKGLGVNLANKVSPCPQDNFNADTCPDISRIGSVVARSKLVPEGQLSGSIYLGQAGDGSFPLLLSLKGFVDLALQGKVAVSSDGTLEATFSNLPEVPIESFTLNLDGSTERGMLKVPTSCRHSEVEARFTSHQGKEHNVTTPLDIGCNQGTLTVDVDPQKTAAHPTVTLEAQASGIRDVSFRLPKGLKVRGASALRWDRSYGSLSLQTAASSQRYPLKPAAESESALSLGLAAVSSGRAQSIATLSPGIVKRSCKRVKRKKRSKSTKRSRRAHTSAKKKSRKRRSCVRTASGGHVISFTDLPDDLTSVSVELEGEKSNFLTTPSKCKKKKRSKKVQKPRLDFSATITDVKGTTYRPSKSVTLKCAKQKKKKSRRASGKRSGKRG